MRRSIILVCLLAITYFSFRATEGDKVQSKAELVEILLENSDSNSTETHSLVDLVNCLSQSMCEVEEDGSGLEIRKQVVEQARLVKGKKAAAYARFIIQFDDYTYQRTALELMATLDPSNENRLAILEGTKSTLSAHIAEMALTELKRYENDHDLFKYISYQIEKGAFTISPTVADLAVDFMTPGNYDDFQAVLDRLPRSSEAYRNLRSSLRDFYLRVLI